MGEAFYYMKARWPSAEEAEEALPAVIGFLERMAEAETYWQAHRDKPNIGAEFPDVWAMLELPMTAVNNDLAGELDSPLSGAVDEADVNECVYLGDPEVIYIHGEVWHFANWDGIARAMVKLGAIVTDWISEENSSPFDQLKV